MNAQTRRQWLLSAAVATLAVAPASADSPVSNPRIAAASLPVTSQSVRLKNSRETRTVVTAIAADPRGEWLAAAGDDHVIRILHASTLRTLHTLTGHRDLIRTLAFDSNGDRLVSAGNDGQMIVWDREDTFSVKKKWNGTPAIACVCCSPKGSELAAVGFHNKVYIVGREGPKPVFECECRDLRAVAYRDDMQVLAVAGRSGALHLFDPFTGELLDKKKLHTGRIHAIAFHRDSNLLVCVGEDGNATVFDSQKRERVHTIPVTTGRLFSTAIVNSELVAVAGSDNVIRMVNTNSGAVERTLTGHHGSVSKLAAAGGWLFSGSYDATVRRWAIADITTSEQRIAEVDPSIER